MKILEIVDAGEDPPGGGVVLQIIQHPVHLVKHAFLILVLDSQLIAVGLADGSVRSCPLIPHMAAQIFDPVGLLLPDPQQLIQGGLPVGAPQGHDGEFFLQVVAVDHTEFLYGMGRGAIGPMGAHLQLGVVETVLQNILACGNIDFVSSAHRRPPKYILNVLYHSVRHKERGN